MDGLVDGLNSLAFVVAPIFYKLVYLSLTASAVGLVFLFIRKWADRQISPQWKYVMWLWVVLALLIPVRIPSDVSFVGGTRIEEIQGISYRQEYRQPREEVRGSIPYTEFSRDIPISQRIEPVERDGEERHIKSFLFDLSLPLLWLFGTMFLASFMLLNLLKLRQKILQHQEDRENYSDLLHRCKEKLSISRNIEIVVQDYIKTPALLGVIKPTIILPSYIGEMDEEGVEYILLHELAHYKRYDPLVNCILTVLQIVYWFNPFTWLMLPLVRQDMELATDSYLLRFLDQDQRKKYSLSLVEVLGRSNNLSLVPRMICMVDNGNNLERRIRMMKLREGFEKNKLVIGVMAILTIAIVSLLFLTSGRNQEIQNTSMAARLYSHRTDYVGDSSKVGGIVSELIFPDHLTGKGFALGTSEPPYSIQVNFETDGETVNHYKEKVNQTLFENNAILMFSLIGNVDHISFNLSDGESEYILPYTRDWANDLLGRDVWKFADSEARLDELLEMLDYQSISRVGGVDPPNRIIINFDRAVADFVETNLDIILSSPQHSSDPQDYIRAHQDEYENIIKLGGEDALHYMLDQFEQGNNNNLRGQIMMSLCKRLLGPRNNVEDETLSPQDWYAQLFIVRETELPNFVYDGDDPIQRLVYETEVARNMNPYRGGFVIVAPIIHGVYEEGNKLKVFTTTYSGTYHLYGRTLSRDGAGVVPSAITYVKNEDGRYVLDQYQQARDGSEFISSIKEFCTLPVSGKTIGGLADQILRHYGAYEDASQLHHENLVKHLQANNQYGVILRSHSNQSIPLT